MSRRLRLGLVALTLTAAALTVSLRDAAACGGLVAPNGSVRLTRASTLVAWSGGIEHYMTSFAYQGDAVDVGWIVPLPAVPDAIEKGGAWTLQRLAREAQPVVPEALAADGAVRAASSVEVLQTTVIDALDITVLKGSGQAVIDWCAANHFTLNAETRAHIEAYAASSPIFMAAKYDLTAARLRLSFAGDGTPVLITMRTPRLWVPLEVLANASDPLTADLYLLTDQAPTASAAGLSDLAGDVPNAPGLRVLLSEPVSASLHADLSSDRAMSWVPASAWLTALRLQASGDIVTYDMTVSGGRLTTAPMGMGPDAVTIQPGNGPGGAGASHGLDTRTAALGLGAVGATAAIALLTLGGFALAGRRARGRG